MTAVGVAAIEIRGVTITYGRGRRSLTAVRDIDLQIPAGGTLGLVGESGSGKSTLGRAIAGLVEVSSGEVIHSLSSSAGRRRIGMVFQNPRASFNPRMTVHEAILEAWQTVPEGERRHSAKEVGAEVLADVGLDARTLERYPHEFSGGQLQRIAIARSLASQPDVIVLDEVTSALDVSVQATILRLLSEVQKRHGLSYLFISHNLAVVRGVSQTIAVMFLGSIVESGSTEEVFRHPKHPYTRALIRAVPEIGAPATPVDEIEGGEMPDPRFPPSGCTFRTRCPVGPMVDRSRTICTTERPSLSGASGHHVACHFPLEIGPRS